ncbi:MAG: PIN domain-containing protein [Niabella sp.]|nr:PIN domain-containing protein [Niabella sp.]
MAFKVFLDANVLLDFTLKRAAYATSKKIIQAAMDGAIEAFITPAIVHITGYWLTKAYGIAVAKEILLVLLADVRIIDISHEVTLNALHSQIEDIEDALQYYTALHHQVDYFISLDKELKKSSIPALPVYTPDEFVRVVL